MIRNGASCLRGTLRRKQYHIFRQNGLSPETERRYALDDAPPENLYLGEEALRQTTGRIAAPAA